MLSARLDGEATAAEAAAADLHLAGCAACRAAQGRVDRVTRLVRAAPPEPAPDPAAAIRAALDATSHPAAAAPRWVGAVRATLGAFARGLTSGLTGPHPHRAEQTGPATSPVRAAADPDQCSNALPLHVVGSAPCGCAASCRCGCQDGRPCRCGTRAA